MGPRRARAVRLPRWTRGLAACAFLILLAVPGRAAADADDEEVSLAGIFVDPARFVAGGTADQRPVLAPGAPRRLGFFDLRRRQYFTVIGLPPGQVRPGGLASLGDTVAIRGHVRRAAGAAAVTIEAVYPVDRQPAASFSWWPWEWHLSVLAGCGLLALLYLLAIGPWRARLDPQAAPAGTGPVALFLGGIAVLVLALNGPLDELSDDSLFWMHMLQHMLLAQVVPLLLLRGLPPWLRRRLLRHPTVSRLWDFVAGVPLGFVLSAVVLGLWHVPSFYDRMMRSETVHVAMHLMLMGTAFLMWWPIAGGDAARRPLSAPGKMLYLFLLGFPMMIVAAPIVLASRPLYEWYALAPRLGGMSALDDQRLGGLIMWIPGGLFYWAVASVIYFRWAAREQEPEPPLLPRAV